MLLSPLDWVASPTTVFVPDLMVVRRDQVDLDDPFTGTPLLVVEVLSPITVATDRTLKRQQYEQHGVGAYWMVDPGRPDGAPSLVALRLGDGAYAEEMVVEGDDAFTTDFPFPVTVVPDHLIR